MITDLPPAPRATDAKTSFGRFVFTKRRESGLTQRELAQRLYVTESAVSKWERGLSYPDISLVPLLSEALGVSEGELINASEDPRVRLDAGQARVYRRTRTVILWSTIAIAVTAVLASLIVNLAVQHTLSWFFVVLLAVAVLFSLTGVPLLVQRKRGWATLLAFLISLFGLLGTTQLLYGGTYLPFVVVSVLFAAILLFSPFAVRELPESPLSRHRLVVVMAVDSLALGGLLCTVLALLGRMDAFVAIALPIFGFCSTFAWLIALIIRYSPLRGLFTAAIVVVLSGLFTVITNPVTEAILHGAAPRFSPTDLSVWDVPYISGNVSLLVLIACLAVAVALTLAGLVSRGRR
ncbi:MAG: helix-turn-helix domain-containing protein [Rhodoglobus sp.]